MNQDRLFRIKVGFAVLFAGLLAASIPAVSHARDPGVNQPGAAGNVGARGVGRDPGVNQPGAAGNRRRVP